jgi:hypothetical protein
MIMVAGSFVKTINYKPKAMKNMQKLIFKIFIFSIVMTFFNACEVEDGIDGVDGRDGVDGVDGRNGVDGQDGEDGEDGGGSR